MKTGVVVHCTCCEKPLRGEPVFLELVEGTGDFYRAGIPAGKRSQGWFPFGKTCASKKARTA
ncbi:MAG: hypothetical protein KGL39_22095 [Patescibacteria group bacterium]|nr:hypothetical protein [Patescibacteria group bacterium]